MMTVIAKNQQYSGGDMNILGRVTVFRYARRRFGTLIDIARETRPCIDEACTRVESAVYEAGLRPMSDVEVQSTSEKIHEELQEMHDAGSLSAFMVTSHKVAGSGIICFDITVRPVDELTNFSFCVNIRKSGWNDE